MAKAKKPKLWTWGEFKAHVDEMMSDGTPMDLIWPVLIGEERKTGLPKPRQRRQGPETDWSVYLREPVLSLYKAETIAKIRKLAAAQQKRWQKKSHQIAREGGP